jgi:CHAT domain-containing protein/tetratricopeptide (TPR) repeat protein
MRSVRWLGLAVLLGVTAGAARGQDLPEWTPEQQKLVGDLVAACAKAGGWTREGKGSQARIRIEPKKLKSVLAERKKQLTPELREALLAGWVNVGEAEQSLYQALLEGMGEVAGDRQASGLAAFLTGFRSERGQRLREAETAYRRAEQHFAAAKDTAWQVTTLNNLGAVLQNQGRYAQAREQFQLVLQMTQRLYPKERYPDGHPDLALGLNNLGGVLSDQGDYAGALEQYRLALKMRQRLYPKERYPNGHPLLAQSLNNLGSVLKEQGEYTQALEQHRLAQQMYQRLYPPERYPDGHPDLALGLNNLGSVLKAQGEYAQALEQFRLALEMKQRLYPKKRFPDGHPDLALGLNNLGTVLKAQGEYAQALEQHRLALMMLQRLYPPERYPDGHPLLALSLNNLGGVLSDQGDHTQALEQYRLALKMWQRLYPKERYPDGHPQLATCLNNLGAVLQEQGAYAQAREQFRLALRMSERLYPKELYPDGHPLLAQSLIDLGEVLQAQGEYAQAFEQYRLALRMYQQLAARLAAEAPEARALNFAASLPLTRDAFLSVRRHLPADAAGDYALIWQSKAALSRVFERRQLALRAAAAPEARKRFQQLTALRRQRERLLLTPVPPDGKERDARLAELDRQIEQSERELAPLLPALPRTQQLARSTPEQLCKVLPARTVLIDLLRYVRFDQDKDTPGRKGRKWTPSYVAFVVDRKGVQRVDLGEARPIEETLDLWRRAIAGSAPGRDSSGRYARMLRRLVWEKLSPVLPGDTSTIYLSPDGPLCRLPWAAVPGRRPGTVLLEEYALAVVPHGLFLLDRLTAEVPGVGRPATLLAVGGVGYDQQPAALEAPDKLLAAAGLTRSGTVGPGKGLWTSLSGTDQELERVKALADKRLTVRTLTGPEAGTDQVRQALPEVQMAHLATHGFFADPSFRSVLQLDEKLFARRVHPELGLTGERYSAGSRSPLVLSGLVLAGANRADTPDRGILSADSLVNLRLDKLELAVLSACESGLGETAGGEGVFGLQRAFHLAGAHNVIASLWKVDDEATAALMTLFYRNLFQEKQTPLEALRKAQLALLYNPGQVKEWSAGRGPDLKTVYTGSGGKPPAEKPEAGGRMPARGWAAFTLSGLGR